LAATSKTKPDNTEQTSAIAPVKPRHLRPVNSPAIKDHPGYPAGANERQRAFNDSEEHQVITANGRTLRGPLRLRQEKAKSISLQNQQLAGPY